MRSSKSQTVANVCSSVPSNEEQIRRLFTRYHNGLVKKAAGVVGELFAEEVVQDAWVTFLQVWDTIRDSESIGPWLNTVVINKSLNRLKKEKKCIRLEHFDNKDDDFRYEVESLVAPLSDEPETTLSFHQKLLIAEASWYRLSSQQQKVCQLRLLQGYEYQQIADELGVSISNSKVLLHRARSRLVAALQ